MQEFRTETGSVAYQVQGSGEPILVIHGTGASMEVMAQACSALATTHTVISYDRPGFGRSGGISHSHAETVEGAVRLLEHVGLVPATVVGWSSGGVVALGLAAQRPDLVASLVVVEAPVHPLAHLSLDTVKTGLRTAYRQRIHRDDRSAAYVIMRWAMRYSTGGNAFDSWPEQWRDAALGRAETILTDLRAGIRSYPSNEAIRGIECPVTLIAGQISNPHFRRTDATLRRLLPHAELVTIAGAGHASHLDNQDDWVAAVRRGAAKATGN